jgi:type IV secretion system protein VirB1
MKRMHGFWMDSLRTAVLCSFLLHVVSANDGSNLQELHDHCVPSAPFDTLQAIVRAESGGNPNAIQLDYPQSLLHRWRVPSGSLQFSRQPRNAAEAIHWAAYLASKGISVDLGLMQVSTVEGKRRNISADELLDPCTNLKVGWSIFRDDYQISAQKHGHSQEALWHALSRYNTGSDQGGIRNGYLSHVMRSLLEEERGTGQTAMKAGENLPITVQSYRQRDRDSSR